MRSEEKIDYSLYEIYEDGRVYSKYWKRFLSDKVKKGKDYTENVYKTVSGKKIPCFRHQVIWYYFNGKVPEGMEIDHIIPLKNGGTNELSNLRVLTHKDNMKNAHTIERLKKVNTGDKNPMYGIKLSDTRKEQIKKQIKEMLEKGIIDRNIPVLQYTLDGNLIKEWKSATDCARQTEFKQSGIQYACNGGYFDKARNKWHNIKQYKGYIWKYKNNGTVKTDVTIV